MKTMKDIESLAMKEPIVYSYLQHVHMGSMTTEQALIGMVVTLTIIKDDILNNYTNHLNKCSMPSIRPFDVGPHPTIAKQVKDMEERK